jgi:hypothetical protein
MATIGWPFVCIVGEVIMVNVDELHLEACMDGRSTYIDPATGTRFQKISKTYVFIADPAYALTEMILEDEYQIFL